MCEMQYKEQWSFTRAFSPLGKLQMEYFIKYSCKKTESGSYCFTVNRTGDECIEEDSLTIQNITAMQAHQMVQYLFENAVPYESWKDVLAELHKLV